MKSVPFYSGRFGSRELRGQEIFNWLHRLDLTRHFDKFLSAGVEELGVVRQLGEEQLLTLGISDVHERLTLLHAIRLLQTPQRNNASLSKTGDIELSVFKTRDGFFYNNNGYHGSPAEADYSECAELNGRDCSCEGNSEEHSYEQVKEVPSQLGASRTNGRNNWRGGVERVNPSLLRSLIKEKVIQDQVDLTRIEDECVLRRIAAQYAEELAVYLGFACGGGASFSSSSSSSSSGYVSSGPDLHPHVLNALRHLRVAPSLWNLNVGIRREDSEGSSYVPGVYQPSSCLRNKEEIYDYVPPRGSAVIPSSFEKVDNYSRPRAESLKLTIGRRSSSPHRSDSHGTTYGFIRSTPRRSVGGQTSLSASSFTVGGSCSSSTTSPSSTSTDAYGFVSLPNSRRDSTSSRDNKGGTGGEGVGETLLRIGRRLGLSRLIKTLRLEHLASQTSPHPNALRRVQSVPTNPPSTPFRPFDTQQTSPSISSQSETNSSSGDRLPSNERIIETINRLKLKELHRRKERIADEHRAMRESVNGGENGRAGGREDAGGSSGGEDSCGRVQSEEIPSTPSATKAFQRGDARLGSQRERASEESPSSPSTNDSRFNCPATLEKDKEPELVESSALRELLKRNDLQEYCELLEREGFESLELFVEVEEEDLRRLAIADCEHRSRLLAAAHSLRPSPRRPPCQTSYQWDYYANAGRKGGGVVAVEVHAAGRDSGVFEEKEAVISAHEFHHSLPTFSSTEKSCDNSSTFSKAVQHDNN